MQKFLSLVATFFGIGKSPKAPGTVATVATIPIWWLLSQLGIFTYMGVTVLLAWLGIFAAQAYENQSKEKDSSAIVIDEVVGFLITMAWLPMTWQSVLAGFVLFRVLDIYKPFPIRQLDKKIPGGFGVMVDDIAAGIIGSIILQFIYTQTNWLGAQISHLTAS